VFGNTARDTGISPDVWRFYLLSRRPETSDAEFKWQELIDANNNELCVVVAVVVVVVGYINGPG
jgi:methionyl-tRNA synthetase